MIEKIKYTIDKFPLGFVFTADDFPVTVENPKGVSKALNKFVEEGYLRKLSKGRFYKPQIGKFGNYLPILTKLSMICLRKRGKTIGYITGCSAFNDLMLTTQVPSVLQVGMRKEKKAIVRGIYRIHFIKQENTITKENIPIMQLLDCLRYFKDIPDTMPDEACNRLLFLFRQLNEKEISVSKRLALQYNPATIALLGALLETLGEKEDTSTLFNALNHQTSYQFGISQDILSNQKRWHLR
jgi:hypothetical protein